MHSDLELGKVLRRSYLFINFRPLRGDILECKETFKSLNKRNRVRVWSEIGYEILGQVEIGQGKSHILV